MVEAATHAIREELRGALSVDQAGIQPYIAYDENQPIAQWKELNHSRRWGAYFLQNEGRRVEEHMARCPRTVATLAELPQVDIPGHGPTAFFSILDAHTRIPPHTGVTNTRLTVHLPLIVPAGCGFRVGGEIREWQVGTAWVFDDSIEHEAWNDSDVPRAILIFDIWNPALTPLERDLVREATTAIGDYYKPDLLLLPIGGHFTMDPKEAALATKLIHPRLAIPMHYGTFPPLKGTPEEYKAALGKTTTKVIVMTPGETQTF